MKMLQLLVLSVLAITASMGAGIPDIQLGADDTINSGSQNPDCGDALFEEGVFSTPQYPSPYPNRQVCTWTLTAPEGKAIRLVFTNFSVEHGVECAYDSVKVYNGPTAVPRNLAKTLCGTKPLIEHVGAKTVTVVFTSNDKIQETGFTAFFHSIPDPTLPASQLQGQTTCGGDYQGAFGTIESPNYPELYPNNLNCSYTITVPSGNVQLEFLHLDIEYHHSCQRDYIEIREENSAGKLLRTVCGSPKSRKISSTTLSLHLRFISDYTLQGSGFYATWKNGDNGEADKHNGLDRFISTTQRSSTTKLPRITVRLPSSTDPAIVVGSSTTAKQTPATPEKSTVAATTDKATPPPAEKSSTAAATKPALTPSKDNSGEASAVSPSLESCKHQGNTHRIMPNTACMAFTQEANGIPIAVHKCPPDMVFDLVPCVCVQRDDSRKCVDSASGGRPVAKPAPSTAAETADPTRAPTVASTTPQPPPTAAPATRAPSAGQGTCLHNGNVYGLLAGTSCRSFTQLAHGSHFRHECPEGLALDLNICVCRFPGDFVCPSGGYNPSLLLEAPKPVEPQTNAPTSPSTTAKATASPTPAPTRPVPAAPGTCVNFDNVYTIVKGGRCRLFTQRTSDGTERIHACPAGLSFDLDICVCRYGWDFTCSDK